MKKKILALAALATIAGAAQADVTLYGTLDTAIGHESHSPSADPSFPGSVNPVDINAVPGSVTGLFNGGISPSRWGIKGDEDLGNGMKAFFTLESGINIPTGASSNAAGALANNNNGTSTGVLPQSTAAASAIDGQLFSRAAYAGVKGSFGSISAGRIPSFILEQSVKYDPVQDAQLFSPLGFSGALGGGGGITENSRFDNSVKYSYTDGPLTLGYHHKFGGVSGAANAGSADAFTAAFETDTWGVQATALNSHDTLAASSDNINQSTNSSSAPISGTIYNSTSYMLSGMYKIASSSRIKAGYEHYTLSAPTDNPYGFSGTTALTMAYYGSSATVNNYTGDDQNVNVWWFGGDTDIGNWNLSAGYYNVKKDSYNKSTSTSASIYPIGELDYRFLSFLADYRFSKMTDAYFGMMSVAYSGDSCYLNASGAKQTSTGNPSNNCTGSTIPTGDSLNTSNLIYAAGLRVKF